MSYRVRNTKTKNFVTKELSAWRAEEWKRKLDRSCGDDSLYEVVSMAVEIEKLSTETRPMSEDEKRALNTLATKEIRFSTGAGHSDFINSLLSNNEKLITEKQAAYLWYIVHHYRKQINDAALTKLSEQNRVY